MTTFGWLLPDRLEGGPADRSMGAPADAFEHLATLAVSAEAAGFDSVWVGDRGLQGQDGGAGVPPDLEPLTLLGALAVRTGQVRLGALVSGVTYPNPGVLAKMVTTIDVISGGRAALGIGGTWPDARTLRSGIDSADHGGDLGRVEEALRIVRALFTDDDVSFEGTHFRLDHARNLPRPVQAGGPGIVVDGRGAATPGLAARYADICLVTGSTASVSRQIEEVHRHCHRVGRDPAEIDIAWTAPLTVTASPRQTREVIGMLEADGADLDFVGCVVGQPHQLPELIGPHLRAGVDQVWFSWPSADAAAIAGVGRSLGLATR
jgi:alkanesulfonate monooxygenase SsuD/methylene tetrahydromethanopterin reductase-like flavin-dependent oxidoreductase (luciferase family)